MCEHGRIHLQTLLVIQLCPRSDIHRFKCISCKINIKLSRPMRKRGLEIRIHKKRGTRNVWGQLSVTSFENTNVHASNRLNTLISYLLSENWLSPYARFGFRLKSVQNRTTTVLSLQNQAQTPLLHDKCTSLVLSAIRFIINSNQWMKHYPHEGRSSTNVPIRQFPSVWTYLLVFQ